MEETRKKSVISGLQFALPKQLVRTKKISHVGVTRGAGEQAGPT